MSKSRKEQIEEMLAADPDDSFLRYGLAMEYASAGKDDEAASHLLELTRRDGEYVPAYLQAGQVLARLGREDEAKSTLQAGVAMANRKGDSHAAGEMAALLAALG